MNSRKRTRQVLVDHVGRCGFKGSSDERDFVAESADRLTSGQKMVVTKRGNCIDVKTFERREELGAPPAPPPLADAPKETK